MEEIYWLQRLGSINTLMWVIFGISFLLFLIVSGVYLCSFIEDFHFSDKDALKARNESKRIFKGLWPWVTISCLGGIFIPTTKEMYAIYGIGGTIDYLKENETAKQLPNKVINALDKWVDGLNEDKEK